MISFPLIFLFFFGFYLGGSCYPSELPHRTLVGVSVIDTQIVRDAISHVSGYEANGVFNHSMRSWLFGTIIVQKDSAYKLVDEEVQALGTILHDIGFDPNDNHDVFDADHASKGGPAVRKFLEGNTEGKLWSQSRSQLLVDTVTSHLQTSGSAPEIRAVQAGLQIDLLGSDSGPSGHVTKAEYDAIVAAYPWGPFKPDPKGMEHNHPKSL